MNQNKATAHTYMLRIARNLIISKITKASYHHMVNAYKKINTQQNDPNFLLHDLSYKTKLGMQQIHLELLRILSYAFTNKIKHISRINISDNYKIVINSPEVHFGRKQ
jgi:DNA-directed RNA polymerase specialized sigma24 family protein